MLLMANEPPALLVPISQRVLPLSRRGVSLSDVMVQSLRRKEPLVKPLVRITYLVYRGLLVEGQGCCQGYRVTCKVDSTMCVCYLCPM